MSADAPAHRPDARVVARGSRSPIASASARPTGLQDDTRPPLWADSSFHGMTATQFLGAFNDNLFKQLVLLLSVNVAIASGSIDLQPLAMAVFSLPFVLFSGLAGFLSDRYPKQRIIVGAKIGEIVVMALGVLAFLALPTAGLIGLLAVLFCMGMQSAVFGPAKYGILPEMLRDRDLPQANGVIQMTTFLAIIFGTASAGWLASALGGRLWQGVLVCVGIGVLGTITSLAVRRGSAAQPNLRLRPSNLAVPQEIRRLLAGDRLLCKTVLVYAMFWMLGGITQQAVNAFGLNQLQAGKFWTSVLVAGIGAGIAVGCLLAGALSRGRVRFGVVRIGALGVLISLLALGAGSTRVGHPLGFWGCAVALVMLGGFAGLYVVPLQVFLQSRPSRQLKGRMIAVQNLASWIAIFLSAPIYFLFDRLLRSQDWPFSRVFLLTALLLLPVVLLLRAGSQPLSEE